MTFNINVNVRVNQQQLDRIEQKVKTIMANQVTQKDLDTAIDNLKSVIVDAATRVLTHVQNLEAAVAQKAPDVDLSAELKAVNDSIDAIKNIDAPAAAGAPAATTNTGAAAQVNPPPPPPEEVTAPVNGPGAPPAPEPAQPEPAAAPSDTQAPPAP